MAERKSVADAWNVLLNYNSEEDKNIFATRFWNDSCFPKVPRRSEGGVAAFPSHYRQCSRSEGSNFPHQVSFTSACKRLEEILTVSGLYYKPVNDSLGSYYLTLDDKRKANDSQFKIHLEVVKTWWHVWDFGDYKDSKVPQFVKVRGGYANGLTEYRWETGLDLQPRFLVTVRASPRWAELHSKDRKILGGLLTYDSIELHGVLAGPVAVAYMTIVATKAMLSATKIQLPGSSDLVVAKLPDRFTSKDRKMMKDKGFPIGVSLAKVGHNLSAAENMILADVAGSNVLDKVLPLRDYMDRQEHVASVIRMCSAIRTRKDKPEVSEELFPWITPPVWKEHKAREMQVSTLRFVLYWAYRAGINQIDNAKDPTAGIGLEFFQKLMRNALANKDQSPMFRAYLLYEQSQVILSNEAKRRHKATYFDMDGTHKNVVTRADLFVKNHWEVRTMGSAPFKNTESDTMLGAFQRELDGQSIVRLGDLYKDSSLWSDGGPRTTACGSELFLENDGFAHLWKLRWCRDSFRVLWPQAMRQSILEAINPNLLFGEHGENVDEPTCLLWRIYSALQWCRWKGLTPLHVQIVTKDTKKSFTDLSVREICSEPLSQYTVYLAIPAAQKDSIWRKCGWVKWDGADSFGGLNFAGIVKPGTEIAAVGSCGCQPCPCERLRSSIGVCPFRSHCTDCECQIRNQKDRCCLRQLEDPFGTGSAAASQHGAATPYWGKDHENANASPYWNAYVELLRKDNLAVVQPLPKASYKFLLSKRQLECLSWTGAGANFCFPCEEGDAFTPVDSSEWGLMAVHFEEKALACALPLRGMCWNLEALPTTDLVREAAIRLFQLYFGKDEELRNIAQYDVLAKQFDWRTMIEDLHRNNAWFKDTGMAERLCNVLGYISRRQRGLQACIPTLTSCVVAQIHEAAALVSQDAPFSVEGILNAQSRFHNVVEVDWKKLPVIRWKSENRRSCRRLCLGYSTDRQWPDVPDGKRQRVAEVDTQVKELQDALPVDFAYATSAVEDVSIKANETPRKDHHFRCVDIVCGKTTTRPKILFADIDKAVATQGLLPVHLERDVQVTEFAESEGLVVISPCRTNTFEQSQPSNLLRREDYTSQGLSRMFEWSDEFPDAYAPGKRLWLGLTLSKDWPEPVMAREDLVLRMLSFIQQFARDEEECTSGLRFIMEMCFCDVLQWIPKDSVEPAAVTMAFFGLSHKDCKTRVRDAGEMDIPADAPRKLMFILDALALRIFPLVMRNNAESSEKGSRPHLARSLVNRLSKDVFVTWLLAVRTQTLETMQNFQEVCRSAWGDLATAVYVRIELSVLHSRNPKGNAVPKKVNAENVAKLLHEDFFERTQEKCWESMKDYCARQEAKVSTVMAEPSVDVFAVQPWGNPKVDKHPLIAPAEEEYLKSKWQVLKEDAHQADLVSFKALPKNCLVEFGPQFDGMVGPPTLRKLPEVKEYPGLTTAHVAIACELLQLRYPTHEKQWADRVQIPVDRSLNFDMLFGIVLAANMSKRSGTFYRMFDRHSTPSMRLYIVSYINIRRNAWVFWRGIQMQLCNPQATPQLEVATDFSVWECKEHAFWKMIAQVLDLGSKNNSLWSGVCSTHKIEKDGSRYEYTPQDSHYEQLKETLVSTFDGGTLLKNRMATCARKLGDAAIFDTTQVTIGPVLFVKDLGERYVVLSFGENLNPDAPGIGHKKDTNNTFGTTLQTWARRGDRPKDLADVIVAAGGMYAVTKGMESSNKNTESTDSPEEGYRLLVVNPDGASLGRACGLLQVYMCNGTAAKLHDGEKSELLISRMHLGPAIVIGTIDVASDWGVLRAGKTQTDLGTQDVYRMKSRKSNDDASFDVCPQGPETESNHIGNPIYSDDQRTYKPNNALARMVVTCNQATVRISAVAILEQELVSFVDHMVSLVPRRLMMKGVLRQWSGLSPDTHDPDFAPRAYAHED